MAEFIGVKSKSGEINIGYKYCIVPQCGNTTCKTPDKIFLSVPKGNNRIKWLHAVRREAKMSLLSSVFCCEDHFNLPEDALNWCRYKLSGGRLKLKPDIVPHLFACQHDRPLCPKAAVKEDVSNAHREIVNQLLSIDNPVYSILPAELCSAELSTPECTHSPPHLVKVQNSVQVDVVKGKDVIMKDVSTQYCWKPRCKSRASQYSLKHNQRNTACSPINFKKLKKKRHQISYSSEEDSAPDICEDDSSTYKPKTNINEQSVHSVEVKIEPSDSTNDPATDSQKDMVEFKMEFVEEPVPNVEVKIEKVK